MDLGLGNLTELKKHLLAEALREGTDYDLPLTALGDGVSRQFERYCNRRFSRAVGATFVCSGDRDHVYLDRYPVESITSVELKVDSTTGYEVQANYIQTWSSESGYVFWGDMAGDESTRLRFTFTGGYWVDTSEDSSGSLPSGATALPNDLKLAWILQSKKVWEVTDPTGSKIVASKNSVQLVGLSLAGLELIPQVKQILQPYLRYQLT